MKFLFESKIGLQMFAFLALIPFMLICPLIYTSIFYGFPINYIENNNALQSFENVFEDIDVPEDVISLGSTRSQVLGSFNGENTCSLFSGKIIETPVFQEDFSRVYLESFQTYVASLLESEDQLNTYALFTSAELKVFPISLDDLFVNDDVDLDLREDFGLIDYSVQAFDIIAEDGEIESEELEASTNTINEIRRHDNPRLYLVYVISKDVIESNDFRCS